MRCISMIAGEPRRIISVCVAVGFVAALGVLSTCTTKNRGSNTVLSQIFHTNSCWNQAYYLEDDSHITLNLSENGEAVRSVYGRYHIEQKDGNAYLYLSEQEESEDAVPYLIGEISNGEYELVPQYPKELGLEIPKSEQISLAWDGGEDIFSHNPGTDAGSYIYNNMDNCVMEFMEDGTYVTSLTEKYEIRNEDEFWLGQVGYPFEKDEEKNTLTLYLDEDVKLVFTAMDAQ